MAFGSIFRAPFANPFPSAGVTGPTVLFYDTFTDTNGTLLSAHTPDIDLVGGGWAIVPDLVGGGTISLTIQSNQAQIAGVSAGTNRVYGMANVGDADCEITSLVPAGTAAFGILYRYLDINNFWHAILTATAINIAERLSGTFFTRSTTLVTNAPGQYDMTVTLTGSNMTASANNATVNHSSSSGATRTSHGIGKFSSATDTRSFDNFRVTTS